jgi:hypothetical protein
VAADQCLWKKPKELEAASKPPVRLKILCFFFPLRPFAEASGFLTKNEKWA